MLIGHSGEVMQRGWQQQLRIWHIISMFFDLAHLVSLVFQMEQSLLLFGVWKIAYLIFAGFGCRYIKVRRYKFFIKLKGEKIK